MTSSSPAAPVEPSLPEGVRLIADGPLPYLQVAAAQADARIYLQGAHLAHFQPRSHNAVLWMSEKSDYSPDKPLRGGVPLVFPWFGMRADHPESAQHGFARLLSWNLDSAEALSDDIILRFGLSSDDKTLGLWPHRFEAQFIVTVGATMTMALQITNTDQAAWDFEAALHTYFAVGDVRQVQVTGLENTRYIDKPDARREKDQGSAPITIAAETDRVYLDTTATCTLHDPILKRRIIVEKSGLHSTVVWNPWIEKAARMPDFGDDEWPQMLCIESANVGDSAVTLAPGKTHSMQARISVEPAA